LSMQAAAVAAVPLQVHRVQRAAAAAAQETPLGPMAQRTEGPAAAVGVVVPEVGPRQAVTAARASSLFGT
jgi:hypothetical protein